MTLCEYLHKLSDLRCKIKKKTLTNTTVKRRYFLIKELILHLQDFSKSTIVLGISTV